MAASKSREEPNESQHSRTAKTKKDFETGQSFEQVKKKAGLEVWFAHWTELSALVE